ncbi:hypothetical protein OX283_009175 [Flavobacterium sp. SUN052]|uniref:hypothetical protein n=1 Tax=Flavobacterium sp. SUN052 TaxID=3002441 RepID=UPI00237D4C61|nr:hypothetical protein [Flavobacterium sp. SUN052]MEC4004824.1 hypothetical protein [Flavobacterium sp. SUN052]
MRTTNKIISIVIATGIGILAIVILFNASENIIHYKNNFIRRFTQHRSVQANEMNLNYNSYYFAGENKGKIYLGNITAPLQITEIDTALQSKKVIHIQLKQTNLPFHAPQIRIYQNNFYVFEGTIPYIFKGSTSNWTATLKVHSGWYFSQLEPIDTVNMVIRYINPKNGQSNIGSINLKDTTKTQIAPKLLQKQIDGIFDTDGSLHWNKQNHKVIYVYRYRNQYSVANNKLQKEYSGNTIDTISKVKIELAKVKSHNMKTFAKPPLIVNKMSATYGNYLYVNSTLPGLYESDALWKNASIIDIYNLTNKSYLYSFPIYHIQNKKMRSFSVVGQNAYALIDNKLIRYKIKFD